MTFDRYRLLDWFVSKQTNDPDAEIGGVEILKAADGLVGDVPDVANTVARAAVQLRSLEWITWQWLSWPGGPEEPPAPAFNCNDLRQVRGVMVTALGHQALQARMPSDWRVDTQVNIIGSSIGQLAVGDITNVDLVAVFQRADAYIDHVDAAPGDKASARSALASIQSALSTVASTAAGSVLAAAIQHATKLF